MIAAVDERQLEDLDRRLRATRLLPGVQAGPWQRGTDREYLTDLLQYWSTSYDWRAAEDRLRTLPWAQTSNGITSIHQRAAGAPDEDDTVAVVLLHGWPDSFLRYQRVLPQLTDVNVVVPCLPGYPYSDSGGADQPTMAALLAASVAELGYKNYVLSGGDIGAQVAEAWARSHPDRVRALHLTDVPWRHILTLDESRLSAAERDFRRRMQKWQATEGAYAAEHSTKPNTLAVGLGDSPAGLASWIVEKLREWSDTTAGDLESVFPRDDLLTWICVYWFTGSIGTSFAPYALAPELSSDRVEVPTVVSAFPQEPLIGPYDFAARLFDVQVWDEALAGGHFAAWEQPEAFVDGLRAAVELT